AAVAGAEDPSFGVLPPGVAQRGDIDDIGIGGVYDDIADVARIAQARVAPGASAVGGFIDAVAMGHIATDGGLAGTNVKHVGGRGSHSYGADSRGVKEAVGDVLPERAATGGLPDATGAAAEIEGAVVGWMASDGHDAPAAMRANATPLERPE